VRRCQPLFPALNNISEQIQAQGQSTLNQLKSTVRGSQYPKEPQSEASTYSTFCLRRFGIDSRCARVNSSCSTVWPPEQRGYAAMLRSRDTNVPKTFFFTERFMWSCWHDCSS